MRTTIRSFPVRAAHFACGFTALAVFALADTSAIAAVEAVMTTAGGSTASVKVTVSITTPLGTSSDDDTKVVGVLGAAQSAFSPDTPPFAQSQMYGMTLNLATTTFNFQLFCVPVFGCQALNISVSNLQFDLAQQTCSPVGAAGAVTYADAMFHASGNYTTSGITSASGAIDATNAATFSARVTNPNPGLSKLDQLALGTQVFVVPAAQLPPGVTALTLTIETNLTNTTLSGPYAPSPLTFDADGDGTFDFCDACTDTDHDGFGDPGFPANTCALDNCPNIANPSQSDHDGDGIGDACDCLADIAPVAANDGVVDVGDLLAVITAWGACPGGGGPCLPDIAPAGPVAVGDGIIDVGDLLAVITQWGPCP